MKKNVLHLLCSTGFFGAEKVVMELLSTASNKNIVSHLGLIENKSNAHLVVAEEARKFIDNVYSFPCKGKLDLKTIYRIRQCIDAHNIHLIHSHGYKSNFYSLAASGFKKIPRVTTCHNWINENYKMKIYTLLDKKILNGFQKIVVVSNELEDQIVKSGINKEKVIKIQNGITIKKYSGHDDRASIRTEFSIDDDKVVIGCICRLDENKGVSYLLKAAKRLINEFNNIILLIVGDGPAMQLLQDQVAAMGMKDNTIFSGYRRDIPSVLSVTDIFVLPSLIEGLPMVLLEAMAAKKPVIATRVGEIPFVITHDKTGILVDPGNVGQLEHALRRLLKHRELKDELSQRGFEKVTDQYSSESMSRKYMAVYENALSVQLS